MVWLAETTFRPERRFSEPLMVFFHSVHAASRSLSHGCRISNGPNFERRRGAIDAHDIDGEWLRAGATIPAITMRKAAAAVLKVVCGIAGLVFLASPFTATGILVCVAAGIVAIITGVISYQLSDEDDNSNSGYWPRDPTDRL
jgi:hypothetical protein